MKIIRRPSSSCCPQGSAITIGNFDGVHLGHQALIESVQARASAEQLRTVVMSFEPMPSEYFSDSQLRIYPLRDKVSALSSLGVDAFYCVPFNRDFSQLTAIDFIEDMLLNKLNAQFCTVGDDFRFGKNRQGCVDLLDQRLRHSDVDFAVASTVVNDHQRISSSLIRNHLQQAELQQANQLLGRRYALRGKVRHGDKIGRQLGYPTANIGTSDNIALKHGVYLVEVAYQGEAYFGACNLGRRPTFNGTELRLETTLFDFDKSIYGDEITLTFLQFIRADMKFDSKEALIKQIDADIAQCRAHIPTV